jgi:hypothetical protein
MSNRNEAGEAKAVPNRHRETTATAPVLDSTQNAPDRGFERNRQSASDKAA